ncbi:hypothetical protein tinsulaeT_20340 [Thalassotalea insulae]|uniref:AMMECR1 domain-containing protein n=1 Tax=Thalassotalea insulae TaxID=2056778 RepID=A0ABQ6GTM6_9GAMM|nr:AmmeMemoRadiSam system protein A [Thalassotalea insulae]GLX78694.1 hypothetical protein tinsulaeT_20340 [Thalassotalea insulae]
MPVSCSIELEPAAVETLKELVVKVLQNAVVDQHFILPAAPVNQSLQQPAASFVTLYLNEQLRGCIGSLEASRPLWHDVCHNAYSSAFNDSRFPPLRAEEVNQLSFDIAVLSAPENMANQGEQQLSNELVPQRDGLILEQGEHKAVFLPSVWQKLSNPRDFINALKQKAGWSIDYWQPNIEISRFTTKVIHGEVHCQ